MNKDDQPDAIEKNTAFLPKDSLVPTQRVDGYTTKGYMTYMPKDPLKKAELMAVEMRRSMKMFLIAWKRGLRKTQASEEKPGLPTCGGKREDPVSYLCQTEPFV